MRPEISEERHAKSEITSRASTPEPSQSNPSFEQIANSLNKLLTDLIAKPECLDEYMSNMARKASSIIVLSELESTMHLQRIGVPEAKGFAQYIDPILAKFEAEKRGVGHVAQMLRRIGQNAEKELPIQPNLSAIDEVSKEPFEAKAYRELIAVAKQPGPDQNKRFRNVEVDLRTARVYGDLKELPGARDEFADSLAEDSLEFDLYGIERFSQMRETEKIDFLWREATSYGLHIAYDDPDTPRQLVETVEKISSTDPSEDVKMVAKVFVAIGHAPQEVCKKYSGDDLVENLFGATFRSHYHAVTMKAVFAEQDLRDQTAKSVAVAVEAGSRERRFSKKPDDAPAP